VKNLNKARLIYLMVMACLLAFFVAGLLPSLGMTDGDPT
jgi:hypothetical protein